MSTVVVPFQPNIKAIMAAIASANDAFDASDADTAAYIADSLDMGMTAGMNPLTLANYLSFLVGPQRAENIARTEMLGGYRDAALNMYRDNSDVVGGWMWSAAAGACVACSEEDGTIHDLDEDMDGMTHNSCRCSPIPITNPWSDILGPLGIDVSDIEETSILDDYVPLSETFWTRSFEEQAGILGSKSAAEAVSRGILEPADFVGHIEGGKYDGALYTKSLREALADKGMSKAEIADLKAELLQAVKSGEVEAATTSAARTESVVRDELVQARTRLEAAQARLDELSAQLSARPRETFTSREEVHAANVEYLTARREVQQLEGELERLRGVFEVREPQTLSEQAAKLAAQREKLAAQRDAAQATLDRLSDKWIDLVLQTGEFDPVDDAEELAALEEKIAAVEQQQAAQLAKLDKLDQQLAAMDSKIAEANMPGAERVQMLRRQVDESIAEREGLYAQQHDLLEEQHKLENDLQNANGAIGGAQYRALKDLYHASLDQTDPAVKQYLKDLAAHEKAQVDMDAARAEQQRIERVMDHLSFQGKKGSEEYAQAKADYDAAVKADEKAQKASTRTWGYLWDRSRSSVYKPELDSIAGFDANLRRLGLHFTPEQIANSPRVLAERARIAGLATRIEDAKAQVKALDKPIKDINKEIKAQLARLRDLHATLGTGAEAFDTLRPFSDVLDLPEGHQPPNALMNQLDYRMREPREVTKSRIIDNTATRLKDNPAWQDYVSRMRTPDNLGVYHMYVDVYPNERDTKSAKLVADLYRTWGVGYRPGTPKWIAMQQAVKDEFGLDAALHTAASNIAAGERFYAENGAAYRAFVRAMYDNTQEWFAEHGITEVDVYRGFGWQKGSPLLPDGITWGPMDSQNRGITEMELNPFQSFSADINISQGTGAVGGGFAGGGFAGGGGGGGDYSLLIGARVPVDRVLSTAQTGFGAKLESEIVVMGRATDTVAYRAGTRVEADLLRQADEQAIAGERQVVYALEDGTRVSVAAHADGTFTLTYQDGPEGKLGSLKVGSSKSYKTEKGVNSALRSMRIANTYVAPVPEELAIREGEGAASRAVTDGLVARLDNMPADVKTVADMQDYVQAQLPNLHRVDLMDLDAQTARLVGNATVNLIQQLPDVADHLELLLAGPRPTDALAYVSNDGLSLIINSDKWLDLADLAARAPQWYSDGWWVSQTPEDILGHEIGHLVQVHYNISDTTWLETMERVTAAGGNPIVSTYGVHNIKEAFAETFALLIYGDPTPAQLPIVREMADLLRDEGLNYNTLRAAVGMSPLDLGASS